MGIINLPFFLCLHVNHKIIGAMCGFFYTLFRYVLHAIQNSHPFVFHPTISQLGFCPTIFTKKALFLVELHTTLRKKIKATNCVNSEFTLGILRCGVFVKASCSNGLFHRAVPRSRRFSPPLLSPLKWINGYFNCVRKQILVILSWTSIHVFWGKRGNVRLVTQCYKTCTLWQLVVVGQPHL